MQQNPEKQCGHRVAQIQAIESPNAHQTEPLFSIIPNNPNLSTKFILDCLNSNEAGDAALFRELTQDHLVYDHGSESFYVWTGHYWQLDSRNHALKSVELVIDTYAQEADRQTWLANKCTRENVHEKAREHEHHRWDLLQRVTKLQTATRMKSVLFLSTVGHGLMGDEWDQDPMLLGTLNGVIDLRTGERRPGRQEDYIRMAAPVMWSGLHTPCPKFRRFIFQALNGDFQKVAFVDRLLGYSITGQCTEDVFPVLYGPEGRNGKTTLMEALAHTLGPYAHKADNEILLEGTFRRQSGAPNSALVALKNKRLVWCSEASSTRSFDTAAVKQLTGGDTFAARGLYERDPIEIKPTHHIFLVTNQEPEADASDQPFWDRVVKIDFNVRFVERPNGPNERRVNKALRADLLEEAPGILAALVRGCLSWQRNGLNPPEGVRLSTEQYRTTQDDFQTWLTTYCTLKPHTESRASDCYLSYEQCCKENGSPPKLSPVKFGLKMKKKF